MIKVRVISRLPRSGYAPTSEYSEEAKAKAWMAFVETSPETCCYGGTKEEALGRLFLNYPETFFTAIHGTN